MPKKRILFIGEASSLSTGFGNIARELLPRLHATNKFEIAEIGCYAKPGDPSVQEFIKGRWKFYFAWPGTPEEQAIFNQADPHPRAKGQVTNQFGRWVFDQACADFKPDICIDWRDWWMLEYQERSPFRSWFKWLIMPTVDSLPQAEEWIETYERADLVMAYSDFGVHQLKTQSQTMKVFPEPMRPGVDLQTFIPMDRNEVRAEFNLSPEIPIIGMVQRNQSRKLILDLIDGFAIMKNRWPNHPLIQKAALLLHTSWPDNQFSYDYPRHINRLSSMKWLPNYCKGLQNSILQTYFCHSCNRMFVGFAAILYKRAITNGTILIPCAWCGKNTAACPTTGRGLSREQLARVYNLMDVFTQASIAEGCGMPVQEAKACGVPTLVTDWSATAEKGRFPAEYKHIKDGNIAKSDYTLNYGGEIIKVKSLRHEPETSCFRAFIDHDDLAQKMYRLITNSVLRESMSVDARKCAEEHYDWDVIAKRWERIIDLVKPKDRTMTWDSPIVVRATQRPTMGDVPPALDDGHFVDWLYLNVLKYSSVDPDGKKMWLMNLSNGMTREQLFNEFLKIGNNQEDVENARQRVRAAVAKKKGEDYVDETEAKLDEEWV